MVADRRSIAVLVTIGLGFTIATSVAVALSGKASVPFPDAGLSNTERQDRVDAAHDRERKYLTSFVANGADPRALPRCTWLTTRRHPRRSTRSSRRQTSSSEERL